MNFERFSGLTAVVGILLIWTIVAWLGVAGPIWRATWTASPSEWLSFSGSLLGSLITLLAACAAWFAVQAQIKEQRRSVESQRRDVANARLSEHIVTVFNCTTAFDKLCRAPSIALSERFDELQKATESPGMLLLLTDPLLGNDIPMISLYLVSVRSASAQLAGLYNADPDGRHKLLASFLYEEFTTTIPRRRILMREHSVDYLHSLSLIDAERYRHIANTGKIPTDAAR